MHHEDSEEFLGQCEYYFTKASIELSLWLRMDMKSFRNLLIQNFVGVSVHNKLHIQLYAAKQGDKEDAGLFLQKKYLVTIRLLPQAIADRIVALLLEALKPLRKTAITASASTTVD